VSELLPILRRALALCSQGWNGDLFELVGEAVDRVSAPPQRALEVLREIQRTVQPGEPFADPSAWAKRAQVGEVRSAIEATLRRLSDT
jgi:hypothetical protein